MDGERGELHIIIYIREGKEESYYQGIPSRTIAGFGLVANSDLSTDSFHFKIFITNLRNSSLLGKNNSYFETNKLESIPYVAYSTISSSL